MSLNKHAKVFWVLALQNTACNMLATLFREVLTHCSTLLLSEGEDQPQSQALTSCGDQERERENGLDSIWWATYSPSGALMYWSQVAEVGGGGGRDWISLSLSRHSDRKESTNDNQLIHTGSIIVPILNSLQSISL